jgi:hypothetical protein
MPSLVTTSQTQARFPLHIMVYGVVWSFFFLNVFENINSIHEYIKFIFFIIFDFFIGFDILISKLKILKNIFLIYFFIKKNY